MTKYALISVSDKVNLNIIIEFLHIKGYTILSTGGTYKNIYENHPEVREFLIQVSDFTQFPEILGGRVKTLHPKIYGGLLWDDKFDTTGIEKIDLVIVNLYPFEKTIENPNVTLDDAIENIDIGGVSLIRAAAKNFKNVKLLVSPHDYYHATLNFTDNSYWRKMAVKGFDHVTQYDAAITKYLSEDTIHYRKYTSHLKLKYGCNPYQENSQLMKMSNSTFPFQVLNGTPGYINSIDAVQSWCLVRELQFSTGLMTAASFKHTAPAGVALATSTESDSASMSAYIKARNSDPLSSFGDFIAISGCVDTQCAKYICKCVSDGIIAHDYTLDALELLSSKKSGKYIVLRGNKNYPTGIEYRELGGAVLTQDINRKSITLNDLSPENIVTKTDRELSNTEKLDMILATITLKYTPSNSITIATDNVCIGIGAGQQNRLDCIRLAGNKSREWRLRQHPKVKALDTLFCEGVKRQDRINASIQYIRNDFTEVELENWKKLFINEPVTITENEKNEFLNEENRKIVLSSDAFMPFRDNVDTAVRFNVSSIVQPGGSTADNSVIEACEEYKIPMVFTGARFFLH